jgi:hypothetical protein
MVQQDNDVVFFHFSPGIPWRTEQHCVKPILSREIWKEIVIRNPINVICPGYFLEAVMLPMFNKVLKHYGATVSRWITPSYYSDFLSIFGIKNSTVDDTNSVFSEFSRLITTALDYPSPIFMDRENNVYFNTLFNYGEVVDTKAKFIDRDYTPFWKQFLRNTCSYPYELAYPSFDKDELRIRLSKLFQKYGIATDKPYVIIDNNSYPYRTADGRTIIPRALEPYNIRSIGSSFFHKKYQVIVLNSDVVNYGVSNVFRLPCWFSINSANLFALLVHANGIYSSDPNIYLTGALVGCSKIFAGSNFDDGFRLQDVGDITFQRGIKRWVEEDEFDVADVMKALMS